MPSLKKEYIEKIYAGWLAKVIGIRLGAPVEGWTYEKIKNLYGALDRYPVDYRQFAADDDSNGPLFFLRALEDAGRNGELQAEDVAEALLNYAPFEHGFFWWGGYGVSTEHTAYLNLRNGIPAPRSGSVEQNGSTMAEQIGGQIFIDTWGLVAPGNPDLAAKYAEQAASVTHGREGVYGGIFIAACIAQAFVESNITAIIEKGLSYIPADSDYARVTRLVMDFYNKNPDDWEACFQYIKANEGYAKYPGNCHIIPNSAVMILSLLYGKGDFDDTLNICNCCGWDTDCNVGNIATIMGIICGLDAISAKWRDPVDDFLACSSVIGSLNIMDVPYGAAYIAKLAWAVAGEELPEPWKEIIENRIDACHFELPGSTHAIKMRMELAAGRTVEFARVNTDEAAFTGSRSLKVGANTVFPGEMVCVYKQTHYTPADFNDSRYDPSFSPLVYPGQTVHGAAYLPDYGVACAVKLYARNARTGELYFGPQVDMEKGKWTELAYTIPAMDGVLLSEAGFAFTLYGVQRERLDFVALVDDLYFDGKPSYSVEMANETLEFWTGIHTEISQFSRLKGHFYLDEGKLNLSCADFGEAYTGHYNWTDYEATFKVEPVTGEDHYVCARVQGGVRAYMAGFAPGGRFVLLKNTRAGLKPLAEKDFAWKPGTEYTVKLTVKGNTLAAEVDGVKLEATDNDRPYLTGQVGLAVRSGSHSRYSSITIR